MRNRLRKVAISVVALIAGAFMTVLATSTPSQQQDRPAYVPPALERREAEMVRQREILRESLGKRPVRAANLRYVQAVIAQVKQDFEHIQVARNGIVRAASGSPLDFKFISDLTGEIKKRASRLESNLALPDPEGDDKSQKNGGELNEVQIRGALLKLCNRIESFVKSPLFETPGVIDVQHSAKASGDLNSILELSGSIRKSAERLNKEAVRQ
ncbi:hypothetical protein BH20ACI3_BH20ACI3_40540 [soil metagenome]